MANFQSYVICTSPRSGSTLLCKLLAATGKAGNPESYFHGPSISDWLSDFDLTPKASSSERDVLNGIFDAARKRGTGNSGIFGLRLQRKSFDFLKRQMTILYPAFASDHERFQAAFGETLFIHLTRSNKLEQAISFVKATQVGLWHLAPDGTELERLSAPREPVYDADEIARNLVELTAQDNDWENWFARENIEPLRVTYDELSADYTEVLVRILDQLGLDREAAKGISPAITKLADATNQDWKERFLAISKISSERL